jgi:hypothetical protein
MFIISAAYIAYISFFEKQANPVIDKSSAIKIALNLYPNISKANYNAHLDKIYIDEENPKLAWIVEVKGVGNITGYGSTTTPQGTIWVLQNASFSMGGIVTIDAVTGKVIHNNPIM